MHLTRARRPWNQAIRNAEVNEASLFGTSSCVVCLPQVRIRTSWCAQKPARFRENRFSRLSQAPFSWNQELRLRP